MITFKSLSMRNFLSFGNVPTIINLERPGTTLVNGEDLDNTACGVGANGVGKEQPIYSKIKTPSGWTTMGEVAEGDNILAPDGTVTTVTGVFPQGVKTIYRVTFGDGRSADAGGEHLWKVFSHRWGKSGTRGEKIITTTELSKYLDECKERNHKPWYNVFVPTVSHADIADATLPINPYLLGALLGDGCLSTPQPRFSTEDAEVVEKLQKILEHTDAIIKKDTGSPDYRINGVKWSRPLSELGLLGTKSNNKFIPDVYLHQTSKRQKLQLLQGLLDTDGTVGKTHNVSFCSVSQQLAEGVQYLVRSLGGSATIAERYPHYTNNNGDKVPGQVAYNVSIHYNNPHELFTLQRKLVRLSPGKMQYADAGLRVVSVECVGEYEAKCIMVSHSDHLYITDDFIVTHNTVVLNALVYALYDKPVSNISKDNLVNNINKKNMEVTIEFVKNGKEYLIQRARKMKAGAVGNYVHLYENSKDITPDNVHNTNAHIERILGIPYELFVRIAAFSAERVPFLELPIRSHYQANQTDIIEELFDLKTLSEKANLLKEVIRDAERQVEVLVRHIDQLEREYGRHAKQLESAQNRVVAWTSQNKKEIVDIQKKLKRLEDVDVDQQRSLHEELADIDNQLRETLNEQRQIEREIKEATKQKKSKEGEIEHLKEEKCPYCNQQYKDAGRKIHECKEKVDNAITELEMADKKLEEVDGRVELLTSRHKTIKSEIVVQDLDELLEIKSKADHYQQRLVELQQMNNPFIEPLKELQDVELEPIDKQKLNDLKTKIDHQKFLLKLLTKKDSFVRKALLNKNIPFLNQRLAHYLTDLGLPHTVEFTHEMTANISQFGRPMDFGNLSAGQRARVNLALSFAFRDALQSLHEHINICMLDEVLDVGLDSVGVTNAARMLKRKARDEKISIYIISHRDEIDSAFDRIMTVQMSKGFSFIKEEE